MTASQQKSQAGLLSTPLSPATEATLVTPSDTVAQYYKALRVYVPSGTGPIAVKVTPIGMDDTLAVTLNFMDGVTVEPLAVQKVYATGTGSCTIHGYSH